MTGKTARQVLDAATTEAQWQETVTEYATRKGWLWYHPNLSLRDEAGFPDLVLVRAGRLVFAELKTETGRVRPAQKAWIDALAEACTAAVYVWRPRDWDTVQEVLA